MGDGTAQRWGLALAVGPEPDTQRQEQRQQQRSQPQGPVQRGNEAPAPELWPGHVSGSPISRAVPDSLAAPALWTGGEGPGRAPRLGRWGAGRWPSPGIWGCWREGERPRPRCPSPCRAQGAGASVPGRQLTQVYIAYHLCASLWLCVIVVCVFLVESETGGCPQNGEVGCLGRDDCATWLEWPKDFEDTDICWIKTAVRIRPLISPPPMLKLQWRPQPTREGKWQQHFGSLKAQVWGVSVPGPNSVETWETTQFKPESSKGSGTTRGASGIGGEEEMEVRMSENKGE